MLPYTLILNLSILGASPGKYLGCFRDKPKNRDMPSSANLGRRNSPQTCIAHCLKKGRWKEREYSLLVLKEKCHKRICLTSICCFRVFSCTGYIKLGPLLLANLLTWYIILNVVCCFLKRLPVCRNAVWLYVHVWAKVWVSWKTCQQ